MAIAIMLNSKIQSAASHPVGDVTVALSTFKYTIYGHGISSLLLCLVVMHDGWRKTTRFSFSPVLLFKTAWLTHR